MDSARDVGDQLVVLPNISWAQYLAIAGARGERPSPRLAYLDGALAVMTTSFEHEMLKTVLARLLEAHADALELTLNGAGNTTYRRKMRRAGLEPDECYFVGRPGTERGVPDLAIEVVLTSGGLDKLEIYRRLGVREVWFWMNDELQVHVLVPGRKEPRYAQRPTSTLIPTLEVAAFAAIVRSRPADQTRAVREYRRSVAAARNG